LDFELVSPDELLEQFVMALLYFLMGGENWYNSIGFLLALSVCMWRTEFSSGVGSNPIGCPGMLPVLSRYVSWPTICMASYQASWVFSPISKISTSEIIKYPDSSIPSWVD
jgi:hypothetical protein